MASEPPPPYTPVAQQPQGSGYQVNSENAPILIVCAEHGFSENPMSLTCPRCGERVTTTTEYENGSYAYLISAGICALGLLVPLLWFGYCLLPFCLTGCKDVEHTCPKCKSYLGHFRRL